MNKKNNIINFASRVKNVDNCCGFQNLDDTENWEGDYELLNKGDYKGLKKYRELMAKNNPKDICAQWRLGEAFILNKEYEKAIEFLTPLYFKNYDYEDIQLLILDALYALGKSEKDFKWVSMPRILRLNSEVTDICYEYLKGKRKARGIYDIFCKLLTEGYLVFDEEGLLNYLMKDARFEIQMNDYLHNILLKVKPKSKNK